MLPELKDQPQAQSTACFIGLSQYCGNNVTLTDQSGTITGNEDYSTSWFHSDSVCSWLIIADGDSVIKLELTDFSTESRANCSLRSRNYLQVRTTMYGYIFYSIKEFMASSIYIYMSKQIRKGQR